MALGSAAPTSFQHRCGVTAALILVVCVALTKSAPTTYDEIEAKRTDLANYFNDPKGCYYNYEHYEEGDRIVTNEPCLNCTCHNTMLMCFLRVCPFSKAIGQDCTVQKSPDQCCPVISCPEVPVHLLTSPTTPKPTTTTTEIGWHDNYGCVMDENEFFPDGAQVPPNPKKPCELCYCIRNRTACIMQECTLHVEGCRPVYHEGVCCPVRYDCDYESEKSTTTTAPQINGGLVFSTTSAPFDCRVNDDVYRDGESIAMVSEKPCQHCYCMRGDIVCAVQDCGEPLRGKDCTPETPPTGQCCPSSYQCANETNSSYDISTLQPISLSDSDENEAEKFPSNEDVYNKLGENQPTSEQDDGNDVESDNTTAATPDNHNTAEETNILPDSDSANKLNEENKQETSSITPNLINQVNLVNTESGQPNYDSTDKPDEPTLIKDVQQMQLPASNPTSNENTIGSTTQTIFNINDNVKVNEENNSNEIPDKNPIQDVLSSNLPIASTENSVESSTKGSELQDRPQDDITTENIAVFENQPIKSSNNEQAPENNKPQSETASDGNQNPPKQSNDESSESSTDENNIQSVPLSEAVEKTTDKLTQSDTEKSPQDMPNVGTDTSSGDVQDLPDQSITQTPQENILQTNNPPILGQNLLNDDKFQENNVSIIETPKVQNESDEQSKLPVEIKPEPEKTLTNVNQDSTQTENVSPMEIPKVENEPTEQSKPLVDTDQQIENKPESENMPTIPSKDSTQEGSISETELPKIENQNNAHPEIVSLTEIPKKVYDTTEQNKPAIENSSEVENQPESDKAPVEEINKDSSQSENVSPTDVPKEVNEPTEQNIPVVDNTSGGENQPESDKTPVEEINKDSSQSENVSPTDVPKEVNEPTEQNIPVVDNTSGIQNQPESDTTSVEQNNQDSHQSENVSTTEIPKVENVPTEQNKPVVDNTLGGQNEPESDKISVEQNNQDIPQIENTFSTVIPSKFDEPLSENKVPENNPIQPVAPIASENDVSTEQPNEENNIFVVSASSPPLFSDNQVKGEESTSITNENNTSDKYSSTEKNGDKTVEVPKPSVDDQSSLIDADNISPVSHTEIVTESQNVIPQANDENNENSIKIKPVDDKVNSNAVEDSPVNSHEKLPVIAEHNDNKFGSNNPVSLEPALTPTTEINYDGNTEIINHGVLINDPLSQENQPLGEHSGEEYENPPNTDSVDHQITHQTETPIESESLTNKYPSSTDEHTNDVTTSLPQQQIVDNNIPVHPQIVNSSEPITTQDETKTPNDLLVNGSPNESSNSYVPTEIIGVQNSQAPTESPVSYDSNGEQFIPTQAPEQNNEYDNVTPHKSQDENVNEIVDQTSVYSDTSSDDKNNLITSTAPNINNVDNVTPSSDKVETGLNLQVADEKPVENTNGDVPVESATNQASSGSIDNADNSMTTNSYADEVPSTDAPASQMIENEVSLPVNPSNAVETNVSNDRPENVVPQLSLNEASTQYSVDDVSTNSPIQQSPNINIINDVEASTNVPYTSEIPNEINQDSNTESELYATQSPTEKNILNANPIDNGKPYESLQNTDKPLVTKTPDYVIDITTTGYSESSNAPESIITNEPVDAVNEVTTSNVDKNSNVITEQYENVQPGVPGEGSCLIDFVTYAHKAEVPKSNPCHEKCECLNSIVTCTSVNCPPAPPQHKNCIPLHPGNESWCCPTYMCEGGIEGTLFDSHNQLGSPQLISTVVLEDKPGEINDEKTPTEENISSTSNPQISEEYNTLAPSQLDSNSNSDDSIGVTEISAHPEIPHKPIEDFVSTDGENDTPVTAVNLETINNEKPVSSDPSIENEKPANSDKPEEYEKPEENNKPIENDQLIENNKPTEIDQPIVSIKPIENSEADSSTTSYVTDDQSITNKPEIPNNIEEQNLLFNTVNESQDYLASSTQMPENYEPAVTNVILASDQNRPEQNSESDASIAVTTYKPSNSDLDQQEVDTDNKASEGSNNASVNEDSYTMTQPTDEVMNLPVSEVNPEDTGTQTPTIVADEKPMISDNNVNGLRPTSIDDIITSVYLVKDAVKNSLETSSKPTENLDQQTGLFEDNYEPTIAPENSLPDQYNNNESQTTVSSANDIPESQQTDVVNEMSPENPTATIESNISPLSENAANGVAGAAQIPNILPQSEVNTADQEVSTDSPSIHPEVETEVTDSKIPVESPTTQRLPSFSEQDSTNNNGPETPSDPIQPQVQNAAEPNTNSPPPEVAVMVEDNKTPEINTPMSVQHEVPVEDTAVTNKPTTEDKPDDANSQITSNSDVPAEVPSQAVVTSRPESNTSDDEDKRFGEPSSSSFRPPVQGENDNYHNNGRPQPETGDAMHIPLDTEEPASNPSTTAPLANYPHKPSYTPIPQSTWTQKPFHQDSTSEAPLQPDQGFPDEYDDENEAVYGPGTCRYGGKVYVSAQQVPRDDPCDFCFCFRGDIICLQQSCPPPIFGCYQENIQGFCCPRYECPVAQATSVNVTTTTTSTTTMVPPHFFANAYRGAARRTGCLIHGHAYRVGEDVGIASGPCLECICGADGKMKCDPRPCSPEPLLRKMMAEAIDQKRR